MNETTAIKGAGLPSDNSPKGPIINDRNVYKGRVEVDWLWTAYIVRPVVVGKQCRQTTMPKGNDPRRQ